MGARRTRLEHTFVVCPVRGAAHRILGGHARKIERGMRTARCPRCVSAGPWVERSSLSDEERDVLFKWWLEHFTDDELAELAQALGVEHASAEAIALARATCGSRSASSRPAGPN